MPNDPLIEAIKTAIDNLRNELAPYTDPTDEDIAQAALAALKAEGVMLCRWERSLDAKVTAAGFNMAYETLLEGWENHYSLTGLEPPKGE